LLSIINDAISELPRLRADSREWSGCAYDEFKHAEFGRQDSNARERYRFLIALQYEYVPEDESLVRFLFDQEVAARTHDDFQGFGEALRIAVFLLSRWKRAGDFWRFASAKWANFDTACGFDGRFLFASGLEPSLQVFAETDNELKDQVRDAIFDEEGECCVSSADLDEWEQSLVAEFPRRPDDESIAVWIDRAIAFELTDEGRELLDSYESSVPDEPVSRLAYWRRSLGDWIGAIEKHRSIQASAETAWDRVFHADSIVDLHLKSGQAEDAWTTILEIDTHLQDVDGWYNIGLGRSLVENVFRIAISAPNEVANSAFDWACRHEQKLTWSTLVLLTCATEAAKRVGDSDKVAHYDAAAVAEQARIDAILKS
jgi:hypothetical protein